MFGSAPNTPKPPEPDRDPKHRPGAYLLRGERDLYEVVEWEGPESGVLRVVNVRTMSPLRLTASEVTYARLVMPAVEVPDYYSEPAVAGAASDG